MTPAGLSYLCQLDDFVDGASRGFTCGDLKLFGVRQGTKVYLYRNLCPHADVPLEWQEHQFLDDSGTLIQCANHGALFVIYTGRCVTGPCIGRNLQPIAHQIIHNEVWVDLS